MPRSRPSHSSAASLPQVETLKLIPLFGVGLVIGIATGALVGAAVASGAYATPVYSCRYVERYDRWGNIRLIRVCDAY